jgi:hypothetical protein
VSKSVQRFCMLPVRDSYHYFMLYAACRAPGSVWILEEAGGLHCRDACISITSHQLEKFGIPHCLT